MKTNKRLATSTFCKIVVKQFVGIALLLKIIHDVIENMYNQSILAKV